MYKHHWRHTWSVLVCQGGAGGRGLGSQAEQVPVVTI